MNSIMTQSDLQVVKTALQACRQCPSVECHTCPFKIRPGKLLHLAESYEAVIQCNKAVTDEFIR